MIWSENRKLSWSDFKSQPSANSDAVALTASGITFAYSVQTSGQRIVGFSTTIEAHFYPNKSWYLKEKGNAYILGHEQLHFDITELFARKFRQEVKKIAPHETIKDQLEELHNAINEALYRTQTDYDEQTNHSINDEVQHQWEVLVAKELKQLDAFKTP